MNSSTPDSPDSSLRAAAAAWTVRRDRGLSAAESIEYELWLAADPRHSEAMQRSSAAWSLLDRLPESAAAPVVAAGSRRRAFWRRARAVSSLAAVAAVVLVGVFVWPRQPARSSSPAAIFTASDSPRTLTLTDGSLVQLNTGSEMEERFTSRERQVVLSRGEAHFSVTKNPLRPFVVRAGALEVRAVGTGFNVSLQPSVVDVIVTEGRVELASAEAKPAVTSAVPALGAGERAVLRGSFAQTSTLGERLVRSRLDSAELAHALAWREPLLRLGGATLAELAIEFERGTGKRLVFADPALAQLRFGGRFRADDIEGFTQVLAATLDLDVEQTADGTFVLRKNISHTR